MIAPILDPAGNTCVEDPKDEEQQHFERSIPFRRARGPGRVDRHGRSLAVPGGCQCPGLHLSQDAGEARPSPGFTRSLFVSIAI